MQASRGDEMREGSFERYGWRPFRSVGARPSARRLLAVPIVGALAFGGLVLSAVPASASTVTGVGVCFGGEAGSGGCQAGSGGSTTGAVGLTEPLFEVGFVTTSPLSSLDSIFIDASTDAPGTQFASDASDYQVNDLTTESACAVAPASVTLSNTGQEVSIPVPASCAASAGDSVEVVVASGETNSPNAGTYDVDVSTTEDTTPVPSSTFTITTIPGAPTSPTATEGQGSIAVGWTDPGDDGGASISGYNVYCSTSSSPSTSGTPSATASGATAASASVSGLTDGTEYFCVATAVNIDGQSPPFSPVVSATPETTVPGTPTSPTATGGDRSIAIGWTDPSDDGGLPISGYNVYCATSSPPFPTGTPSATASGASATSATVTRLTNGLTYLCIVTAVNADGQSVQSSQVFANPSTVPAPPSSPSATPSNASAVVRWKSASSNGGSEILGYDIYCSVTSPPSTTGLDCASNSGDGARALRVRGLTNGVTYYFVVTATNAAGQSVASSVVSATPVTVPGSPTATKAAALNDAISLTWDDPTSDGGSAITSYDLYCSITDPPSSASTPSATVVGAGASQATLDGLRNGRLYYCIVTAVNAVGQSKASGIVRAKPRA
jgi:trimeric autotransporter adhesin